MSSPTIRPAPEEVAPGIWRMVFPIPTFLKSVNVYLIGDRDGFALIDCGMDTDDCWRALTEDLDTLRLSLRAVNTIVATHGHPDHTGMANRIRAESGAAVWLHGSERGFIDYRRGDNSRQLVEQWLLRHGVPAAEAEDMVSKVREGDKTTPAVEPTHEFHGGEELPLGSYRFEVHWTPGHTPGHVCLYDPSSQTLLCGDHVLEEVAPNVSLQPYTDENPMPGYLASLEWLGKLPIQRTLPGHGRPFPSPKPRVESLIAHQTERQAHVRSLLTHRPRTTYELAAQVWATTKPNTWADFNHRIRRNAMGTLAAHLELLVDRGQARRVDDGVVAYCLPD